VGQGLGKQSCDVEHVGMVISGRATAAMDDGRVIEMKRGDVFYIAPGHDSWVVGDEPYVSIHLLGAGDYAAHKWRVVDTARVVVPLLLITHGLGFRILLQHQKVSTVQQSRHAA
jgi:hypothetical protein